MAYLYIRSKKIKHIVLLIFTLFAFSLELELDAQTTVTVTLTSIQDAGIDSGEPGGNWETSTDFCVGYQARKRGLVQFDLSSIPHNAYIVSAEVTLYRVGGNNGSLDIYVHNVTSSWLEDSVTWNQSFASHPWNSAGGDYNPVPIQANGTSVGGNGSYSWNIQSQVQNWIYGVDNNYGLMFMTSSSSNNEKNFASRENGNNARHPKLTITYYVQPDLLWLRAGFGTNTTTEGGLVSSWANQMGTGGFSTINDKFLSTNNNYRPSYRSSSNLINFNPTIEFNGTDDYLAGPFNYGIHDTNKFTTFAIVKNTGSTDFIWGQNHNGDNAASHSISTVQRVGSKDNYLSGLSPINALPSLLGIRRTADNNFDLFKNGTIDITGPIPSGFSGTYVGNSIHLGTSPVFNHYFKGFMAEIAIFNRELTIPEVNIVNSYLAVKYGITQLTNYVSTTGAIIYWNNTGNGGFNNGIFGLGRDDGYALHQQIAHSTTDLSDILTVSTNSNFILPNGQHTAIANDVTYIMFGNNNASLAYQAFEIDLNTYTSRLSREWKVQNTNFPQTVNLKFTGYSSTPITTAYLIKKNNNSDFSTGTTEVGPLNADGEITGVMLNNNDYFTLAFRQTAPGGVLQNLNFWVKADAGVTSAPSAVSQWSDQSGNNRHILQNTNARRPTLNLTGQNFNPTIHFNANNTQFFARNGNFNIFTNSYSIYIVGFNSSGQRTFITVNQTGGNSDNSGIHIEANDPSTMRFLHRNPPSKEGGDNLVVAANTSNSRGNVMSFYRNTTIKHKFMINGEIPYELTPLASAAFVSGMFTDMTVGQLGSENQRYLDGDIAEIIIYSNDNEVSKNKIESYLAVKYGVSLNDGLGYNYTASNGTLFWNATANSGYHHDIFGIGRDDLSSLYQKQSTTVNNDPFFAVYYTAADLQTLPISNQLNPYNIPNNHSFLMFGNDNATLTEWAHYFDKPPFIINRLARVWKVQKTGTIPAVTIVVADPLVSGTIGANTLYMIVSATENMRDADYYPMTLQSGTWRVSLDFFSPEANFISFGFGEHKNPMRHGKGVIDGVLIPYN